MSFDEVCEYELLAGDSAYMAWLTAGKPPVQPVEHLGTDVDGTSTAIQSGSGSKT